MYLERMTLRFQWGRDNFRVIRSSDWIHAPMPGLSDGLPQETRPRPAASAYPHCEIASIERARCATDARDRDARQDSYYREFQRRRVIEKPNGWKEFNPSYKQPKKRAA